MIPQRTPGKTSVENGVRYRVAACRQRLRNSRTTHRATNHSQIQEEWHGLQSAYSAQKGFEKAADATQPEKRHRLRSVFSMQSSAHATDELEKGIT
jgi:hypothetical protein